MIPGLENAEFLRYGQIHRNTYINGPALLDATLQLRTRPDVFFAGQISGVEGYVESIATGLVAGAMRRSWRRVKRTLRVSARNRDWVAVRLRFRRRCRELPAREYHVRSTAEARESAARPLAT